MEEAFSKARNEFKIRQLCLQKKCNGKYSPTFSFLTQCKIAKKSHMLFCNGSAANNMQKHFRINKGGGGGGGKGCLIFFSRFANCCVL